MKIKIVICYVFIVLMLCSCSTHRLGQTSKGEIETGEKVLIETDNLGFLFRIFTLFLIDPSQTRIKAVDGEWMPRSLFTNDKLALEPGNHRFEFVCERGADNESRVETRSLHLDVMYRYIVTCSVYQGFTIKKYLVTPHEYNEV
ncbi:MAG: hypothetical protein COA78_25625 [Blastopirellula sp.]|nr:MAG: hypothetical protein COA78_25625 [Blastopirellula sp.]